MLKLMYSPRAGETVLLETIEKRHTHNVHRGGMGCSLVLFVIGGTWTFAGICSFTAGTWLGFFGGIFILLLSTGVLYAGFRVQKWRKQNAAVDVRLKVLEVRCVETQENPDPESTLCYAIFTDPSGVSCQALIPEYSRKQTEGREGYLVIDTAHRDLLMFFPKDLWSRTGDSFTAR